MKRKYASFAAFILLIALLLPSMCAGCVSSSETESSLESAGESISEEIAVESDVSEDTSTAETSEPGINNDLNAINGYENINLTYNFRYYASDKGRHSVDDFMPYVAYLDKQGNIKDYFFDSYLFLPCADYGPSGASMHANMSNPTKAIDWTSYVDDTFAAGANVNALDSAFGLVKQELGDSDKKVGVFLTILYPNKSASNFGSLGGKTLNFSKTEDRKYAIKWTIDENLKKFNNGGYENLELVGFYWLEEYLIEEGDVELLQYASEYLHSKGLKFIWIPWYLATGYDRNEELGFDVTCMQPNLFWLGYTDPNRVNESTEISKEYGMSMEMELDYRVGTEYYFNRYIYYLEGGMKSGMMDLVKMYYQDTGPGVFYSACYSGERLFRAVYDLTYKYAKGTLTQSDIDTWKPQGVEDNFVKDIEFGKIFDSARWISLHKSYTGCPSYVDGNGAAYQEVDGKELTDGIIASEDLSTDWFAFHNSIRDQEGMFSITIDLGEVRNDIKHFAAHFDNKQLYAIGSPMDIAIFTSVDGVNFEYYASPQLILDPNYSAFYINGRAVTARYIKMSIGRSDKLYIFCSEFLVGVDKPVTDDCDCDVNSDGKVDMFDYLIVKKVYFGKDLTIDQYPKADCNSDGIVDPFDYLTVKSACFGVNK